MSKYFYVQITKKNETEDGICHWYNEFVGYIFLVKNDKNRKNQYELASGCAWILKKYAKKVEVTSWSPTG